MKLLYTLILTVASSLTFSINLRAQAMDFTATDCNGNPQHLFADLDAGQAVVLFYYMSNCGSCPPPAQKIQAMADKINQSCPGMVKGYAYSYQNSTTCTYTANWVASNNLPLFIPMAGNGAEQVAFYGGFGMPTVVLLGGTNHDILWSTLNFVTSDTTTMRDLILNMNCVAGLNDLNKNESSLTVYPNPSNDVVTLNFTNNNSSDFSYTINDLLGKTVVSSNTESLDKGIIERKVNTTSLANGNYLLKISLNGIIETRKISIIH
ncbi:MAG: hypothetical protein RI883_1810 [Bacteroidota bacterium]|jgi:hypothetical protein